MKVRVNGPKHIRVYDNTIRSRMLGASYPRVRPLPRKQRTNAVVVVLLILLLAIGAVVLLGGNHG